MKCSPGLTYTNISRATTCQGVKLINFTPDKIKVNNAALQETVRMRNSGVFKWQHQLLENHIELTIAHLNMRSWKSHHRHIIKDPLISKCTILGLSETHVSPSSSILAPPGDKWQVVHHHTLHGLALLVQSTSASIKQLQRLILRLSDISTVNLHYRQKKSHTSITTNSRHLV